MQMSLLALRVDFDGLDCKGKLSADSTTRQVAAVAWIWPLIVWGMKRTPLRYTMLCLPLQHHSRRWKNSGRRLHLRDAFQHQILMHPHKANAKILWILLLTYLDKLFFFDYIFWRKIWLQFAIWVNQTHWQINLNLSLLKSLSFNNGLC